MFVTESKAKIGEFTIYGLNDVEVKKSLHSYVNTGFIKLPARARVKSKANPKAPVTTVETANQFKEGDKVQIWLGYDGDLRKEFEGFVRRVNKTRPCEIEFEGYSWQLRERTNVNKFWKKTTVKEIMTEAIKGTDIKLRVDADKEIVNYTARNMSGAQVLDELIGEVTGKGLVAYFIDDSTLYIGLKYAPYLSTVKYKIGFNTIKDDELKDRLINKTKLEIQFVHKSSKGKRVRGSAKTQDVGGIKKKVLTSVANEADLKEYAEARLSREAYDGYEGTLTAFLQPFAQPGDKCQLIDPFFDRGGGFIIDSTKTKLNRQGGRREFGISLKVD